jgi:Peptidase M15
VTPLRQQRISPHFVWGEFYDRRRGAAPPMESRRAVRRLVTQHLEPLRERFGAVYIHSAYRTLATNRLVGGAAQSRHLYSRFPRSPAVDLSCARGEPTDWYSFLHHSGVTALGLYTGHVHADERSYIARWTG